GGLQKWIKSAGTGRGAGKNDQRGTEDTEKTKEKNHESQESHESRNTCCLASCASWLNFFIFPNSSLCSLCLCGSILSPALTRASRAITTWSRGGGRITMTVTQRHQGSCRTNTGGAALGWCGIMPGRPSVQWK